MASAECGSLLDDSGICPVCVQPGLSLDAGSAATVREGGKLALPLIISNASTVKRPLFIGGLWAKEDDGELKEISLPFKRIEPGKSANVSIHSGILNHTGIHCIDLRLAVSTRYEWREEEYMFSSMILFPVEGKDPSGPITNISLNADEIGPGTTIYNPTRIESDRAAGLKTHTSQLPLKLLRADHAERLSGRRGYSGGLIVPRDVEFEWADFPDDLAPFDGQIAKPSGLLTFGRGVSSLHGGPTDIRLLVGNDYNSEANKKRSLAISRQHFTLYVECGRLTLHVESQFGVRISGQAYGRTKTVILNDGDIIEPIVKNPKALSLSVSFENQHDTVRKIVIRRNSPS